MIFRGKQRETTNKTKMVRAATGEWYFGSQSSLELQGGKGIIYSVKRSKDSW